MGERKVREVTTKLSLRKNYKVALCIVVKCVERKKNKRGKKNRNEFIV